MSSVPDILRRIVEQRRRRLDESRSSAMSPLGAGDGGEVAPSAAEFLAALRSASGRAVIAEVKLGSPRLGSLAERIDPEAQARIYAEHGAAALSVVVEPDFFHGSYELLQRCRRASGLSVLAKDFVVDELQLEWAQRAGASAVLLIAAVLTADELRRLAAGARSLGLTPLVECHSTLDLDKLEGADWEMIGVNNRDLRTFEVDLRHSIDLLEQLPAGPVRVAESGISSAADITRLESAGFDAFLVGESLLLAREPSLLLEELVGAERPKP